MQHRGGRARDLDPQGRRWFKSQGGIKVATNRSTDGPFEERSNSRSSVYKTSTMRSKTMVQSSDNEQYRGTLGNIHVTTLF